MSRNLVKFYNTNDNPEKKEIDTNARMERILKEVAQEARRKPAPASFVSAVAGENAEAGFVEGLDADQIEALMADEDEFGNVIKAVDPEEEAERIRLEAQAKADEIVATAEQLAREFKENSRREAEIECARIRTDAKNEGYQDGVSQAQSEYAAQFEDLNYKAAALEQEYQELCSSLEARFISTLADIYEHIFKVDLAEYEPLVARILADTIHNVESSKAYIVHVSAEDYPSISMEQKTMLEEAAPGCSVDVVQDIALGPNQCLLETDNGVFDCGLDTQLKELRRRLMLLSFNPDAEN